MNCENNFDVKPGIYNDEELLKISSLLSRNFKKKISIEFLKWLYIQNPFGKAITFNAYLEKDIIGHYCLIPIKLYDKNLKIYQKSSLSVHTVIDEKYRGGNIFRRLAKKSFENAIKESHKFIIGISNAVSTKIFKRFFGFQIICPLDVQYGFFSNSIDNKKNFYHFEWCDEHTKWRLDKPNFNYNKINFSTFYKGCKINLKASGNFKTFSLASFLPELYIGLNTKKKIFGFNVPEFIKPSPLNLIIKDLSNNNYNFIKNDFQISPIDLIDTF